jgi:hypothetical protein
VLCPYMADKVVVGSCGGCTQVAGKEMLHVVDTAHVSTQRGGFPIGGGTEVTVNSCSLTQQSISHILMAWGHFSNAGWLRVTYLKG